MIAKAKVRLASGNVGRFSGGRLWLGAQIRKQRLNLQPWVTAWGWGGVDGVLKREE